MKTFKVSIKSHCDYPTYEDTCQAKDKDEAIVKFLKIILN